MYRYICLSSSTPRSTGQHSFEAPDHGHLWRANSNLSLLNHVLLLQQPQTIVVTTNLLSTLQLKMFSTLFPCSLPCTTYKCANRQLTVTLDNPSDYIQSSSQHNMFFPCSLSETNVPIDNLQWLQSIWLQSSYWHYNGGCTQHFPCSLSPVQGPNNNSRSLFSSPSLQPTYS